MEAFTLQIPPLTEAQKTEIWTQVSTELKTMKGIAEILTSEDVCTWIESQQYSVSFQRKMSIKCQTYGQFCVTVNTFC